MVIGEVLVGFFMGNGYFVIIIDYGIGNFYILIMFFIIGKIGEDFVYYLIELEYFFCCWV